MFLCFKIFIYSPTIFLTVAVRSIFYAEVMMESQGCFYITSKFPDSTSNLDWLLDGLSAPLVPRLEL